ncbi:MAG: serine hydrolase domain-containing protein, partial [Actinomycetota bacterium]
AFHGVTSVENPLAVDESTLFQFGSTGKTFTATAIMCLVDQGRVQLDARVRTYVPELRLEDESVAEEVTILHLLNHTAGWSGDLMEKTGEGDDALARYVEKMADLEQVTPLGTAVSYNNASLSLAGRVIEKVTGTTYEQAIKDLILDPLGLRRTFFFPNEIMTHRFAVGHIQQPDGSLKVVRPWGMSRGGNPAGGMSANAADQIGWARFHLGDGTARDGSRILSPELLRLMQEPTVEAPGSAIGDKVGISWLLRDVDGVRLVAHGGTMIGQHSDLLLVPEHDFALISMTNSGPNGNELNEALQRWALQEFLGIVERDPEPIALGDDELARYAGTYETIAATVEITPGDGGLVANASIKPEVLEQLREQAEDLDEQQPPIPLGILPGEGDRYVVTGGPAKGMKGYFVRDGSGAIEAVHLGGRLATRTTASIPQA